MQSFLRGGSIQYWEGGPNFFCVQVNISQALKENKFRIGKELDLSWSLRVSTELRQRSTPIPMHQCQPAPGEVRQVKMLSGIVAEITCCRSNGSQRRSPAKAVSGIPGQSVEIFAIIDDTSVMNFRKKLQHDFPKMRGGQRPFGTFAKIHLFYCICATVP